MTTPKRRTHSKVSDGQVSHLERQVNHEQYGDYHSPDCSEVNISVPRRSVDDDGIISDILRRQ